MHMRLLLISAALVAVAMPAAAHGRHPAEQGTRVASLAPADRATAILDAFHRAVATGDSATAASLLGDDAVIFEHGGAEHGRAEYVSKHLSEDVAYARGVKEALLSQSSHVRGTMAWVITEGHATGTFAGKPVNRRTTETAILRRTRAGWRIVHLHWSSGAGES